MGIQRYERLRRTRPTPSKLRPNNSSVEGFSNTFIQAWMRAVPVVSIAADPDGILAEHRLGFCDGTHAGAREWVRRLAVSPDLRTVMGLRARAYSRRHLSLDNARDLVGLLVQAANCRGMAGWCQAG